MNDASNTNPKLRTLVTIPGPDDLCTRYVVRTAWLSEETGEMLTHEIDFGWNYSEAKAWIACSV